MCVCNAIITMAKGVTQLLNRNERDCSNNSIVYMQSIVKNSLSVEYWTIILIIKFSCILTIL